VVVVLFIAGDQVPVIPLLLVVGNAEIVAPEQKGPTAVKVGVTLGLTVTVNTSPSLQPPAVAVYS
jgi:hypothetical protein